MKSKYFFFCRTKKINSLPADYMKVPLSFVYLLKSVQIKLIRENGFLLVVCLFDNSSAECFGNSVRGPDQTVKIIFLVIIYDDFWVLRLETMISQLSNHM